MGFAAAFFVVIFRGTALGTADLTSPPLWFDRQGFAVALHLRRLPPLCLFKPKKSSPTVCFAGFGIAKTEQSSICTAGELFYWFYQLLVGSAKVQGDRKALPVKPQRRHCQICRAEGSTSRLTDKKADIKYHRYFASAVMAEEISGTNHVSPPEAETLPGYA